MTRNEISNTTHYAIRQRFEAYGKDLSKLQAVIDKLANGDKLDDRHRDHALIGNYNGCRECRVSPDWLLVYKIDNGKLVLLLYRLGSHSELFAD